MSTAAAFAVPEEKVAERPQHWVTLVPMQYCAYEWPNVCDMLEPAVIRSGGRWTMHDLLTALCVGNHQLWLIKNTEDVIVAAMTTQFAHYPSKKMIAVQFLGGSGFEEWGNDALDVIEYFAKNSGYEGVEAVGRFGFWPFFKRRGYEKSYCTYEKSFVEDES